MNYKKILAGLFASICLFWVGGYFVLFYSPLPLKAASALGQKFGVQSSGITGSLANGYNLGKVSFQNENFDFEVIDMGSTHSSIWAQIYQKKVVFEDVHLGSARLIVKKWPEKKSSAARNQPQTAQKSISEPKDDEAEQKAQLEKAFAEMNIEYKSIHFGTIEFKTPEMPESWKMERFDLKNLIARNKEVKVDSIQFQSKGIEVALQNASMNQDLGQIKDMRLSLLPPLNKAILKKIDIQGDLQFYFDKNKASSSIANIKAFEGKLVALVDGNFNVKIQTKDLSPYEYVKYLPPVSHLNLKTETNGIFLAMGASTWTGSFNLGQAVFNVSPSDLSGRALFSKTTEETPYLTAKSDYNTVEYELKLFNSLSSIMGPEPQNAKWIKLAASKAGTPEKHLAFLLFGKDTDQMSSEEVQYLTLTSSQIEVGAPTAVTTRAIASRKAPKKTILAKQKSKKAPSRMPASFRK